MRVSSVRGDSCALLLLNSRSEGSSNNWVTVKCSSCTSPGALSKKYNPDDTNPISLCGICFNQKTCPSNVSERYFSYQGAYRCLTEGAGDVAFVSHLTVFDFTGRDNDLNPGKDFELLCPDGTRAGKRKSKAIASLKHVDSLRLRYRKDLRQCPWLTG